MNSKNIQKIIVAASLCSSTAWGDQALIIKNQGRAPEARLKMKSSKVPSYSLVTSKGGKVTQIPRIDIGEEPTLQAAEMTVNRTVANQTADVKPIKKNMSPEVLKIPNAKELATASKAKVFVTTQSIDKIPDVKSLIEIPAPKVQESEPKTAKIDDMTADDLKLLQGLIFMEMQKNYEVALAIFAELLDSKEHKVQAHYQYAMAAKGLGLNTEFRDYMLKVTTEAKSKEWKANATAQLAANVNILDVADMEQVDPLVQQLDIDTSSNDLYQLMRAKYYLSTGDLGKVEESVMMIPEKSEYAMEALLVSGFNNYRRGRLDEAARELDKVVNSTDKKWPMHSVAAITLARMQFQQSKFKEAFQSYLQVDKNDPLWLQAMVEQAWTQILVEDYEGAAGNMFSLHTDFFKNAFSPETYVVRTVGYLNLCQYGDGMQVLNDMKRKYGMWRDKMNAYKTSHKKSEAYYDTVKSWLKNSDLKEVDGLPRSFIIELARHPGFLKVQGLINGYEDEISKFNKITINLIRMEKEILQKQNEVIKTAQSAEERERRLEPLKTQQTAAKKASATIKKIRERSVARIDKEKQELRIKASIALQQRFQDLNASLEKVLSQNDVLQYELYSGAGEHIRYQMAGGDVNDKKRDELKVQDGKSLYWKTKGEVWEDEVGHYRSSLKNVCPKDSVADAR